MIYRLNDYRLSQSDVLFMLNGKYENISIASVASGVPVVVVAYMLGNKIGFDDKLNSLIQKLKEFYLIKEVVNENC